jgi:serine/threonine protein kinase
MHFAVRPLRETAGESARRLGGPSDECLEHSEGALESSDDSLDCCDIVEAASAIFESSFASLGFRNEGIIAFTRSSLIFRASADWFSGSASIKLFLPELMESRFALKIFLQEADSLSFINHSSIAPLYHYGIASNGAPYLISQFVPGQSLLELTNQSVKIEPVSLFTQLCEGLVFAHSQKILHGRLSASKIVATPLLHGLFTVKMLDFSVCAALRLQLPFRLGSLRSSASPEERFGQDPDFRSDIYSLGYVMYETLAGSRPLYNRSKDVIGLSPLRGVSQLLEPLVVRCLAYEPKDRYQSARELLHDLQAIESALQ